MVHILFNLSEAVLVFAAVNILHSAGALDRIWAAPITAHGEQQQPPGASSAALPVTTAG